MTRESSEHISSQARNRDDVTLLFSEEDADLAPLTKVSYVGRPFIGSDKNRRGAPTVVAERILKRDIRKDERICFRNRNIHDMRRKNIAVVSVSARTRSCKPHSGSSSRFKGVSWETSRRKWVAGIRINGKNVFLGRFDQEKDAARKYNQAVKELGIEVAYLNDV